MFCTVRSCADHADNLRDLRRRFMLSEYPVCGIITDNKLYYLRNLRELCAILIKTIL